MIHKKDDVSVVLCGEAGMGIQTVEGLLTRILKLSGRHLFATKEYMSRVRGGANSTSIRVASYPVSAFVGRIDVLVPLNSGAFEHVRDRLSNDTVILADLAGLGEQPDCAGHLCIDVPFGGIAQGLGNRIYSSVVAVGTLAGLFGVSVDEAVASVSAAFSRKGDAVVQPNVAAARAGHEAACEIVRAGKLQLEVQPDPAVAGQMFLCGADAVGLGALAAGCNFVSSYPMSPSTPVLTFMARHSNGFEIVVEQAEDEIAAINMAMGAWYAGGRAMATTSGGGFALMTEGFSLAGMIESPLVVHLGQRPGPATGLPTRTEQGDLNLALYAGHGEFPRVLFAPGTLQDAVELTHRAFGLADKHQVPAVILTDQYFIDSYYNIERIDPAGLPFESFIVETGADYVRHAVTPGGVSPRGVPGFGKGFVCVDSDEHDTAARITEDRNVRVAMHEKRLRKLDGLVADVIEPRLWPQREYRNLVVCWGSTYPIVREALERLGRDDTSLLHYRQVYPVHRRTAELLGAAARVIAVENNATGQFANLIRTQTGVNITERILKSDGWPFSVEEMTERLGRLLA